MKTMLRPPGPSEDISIKLHVVCLGALALRLVSGGWGVGLSFIITATTGRTC